MPLRKERALSRAPIRSGVGPPRELMTSGMFAQGTSLHAPGSRHRVRSGRKSKSAWPVSGSHVAWGSVRSIVATVEHLGNRRILNREAHDETRTDQGCEEIEQAAPFSG